MSEPRTWSLPEEPPVGTVVGPVNGCDQRRWRRTDIGVWACVQGMQGKSVEEPHPVWIWRGLLDATGPEGVCEYPDLSDPDGAPAKPPICSAHGRAACPTCSLNPANCSADFEYAGDCRTYAEDGMHWDTCPNRVRGVRPDGSWNMGNGRVIGPFVPSDPDGTQSELDALRAEVARLDQALRDAAENLTQAERDRDDANQNAHISEQRRSELNLRMREVSNFNARIVHVLLGSFDEKGDRDAQAAAAIGRAEALVEAAGSAVTS